MSQERGDAELSNTSHISMGLEFDPQHPGIRLGYHRAFNPHAEEAKTRGALDLTATHFRQSALGSVRYSLSK